MNVLELAKGRQCQFWGPECLAPQTETVVPCHIRKFGLAGTALRPCDALVFWGCANCHDLVDGRRRVLGFDGELLDLYVFAALCRTLSEIDRLGGRIEFDG